MAAFISDAYRALNVALHKSQPGFGGSGHKWAGRVLKLADELDAHSILDYGAGKGTLGVALVKLYDPTSDMCDTCEAERSSLPFRRELTLAEYDPAIAGKDGLPDPADLVVCTDVLEHVEPAYLDDVVRHVLLLADKAALVAVACRPGKRPMADGTLEHRIVENADWWHRRLRKHAAFVEVPALRPRAKEYAAVYRAVVVALALTVPVLFAIDDADAAPVAPADPSAFTMPA